jgi:hypothetical protein
MVTSLERRVRRLEEATGGGSDGCERCAGTTVAIINGKVDSVTKRGHKFPHATAVAFVAEEGPGRVCPVCGTHRRQVASVGGPVPSR